MADFEIGVVEHAQVIADDLMAVLHGRILTAQPVELLSDRDDKVLQVVEEANGQKFVTRSFTDKAVSNIETRGGIIMPLAWEAMNDAFSDAGLPVVKSSLIEDVGKFPYVVVSEYIENPESLASASTELKQETATGLGRLMAFGGGFGMMPNIETANEHMFGVVTDPDGNQTVKFMDMDPLVRMRSDFAAGSINAAFMQRVSELLWYKWCSAEERKPVISSFVSAIGGTATGPFADDYNVMDTFMKVHQMAQGLDPKTMRLS